MNKESLHTLMESEKSNLLLVLTAVRSELGIHLHCSEQKCVTGYEKEKVKTTCDLTILSPNERKDLLIHLPKFLRDTKVESHNLEKWLTYLRTKLKETNEYCETNETEINNCLCRVYEQTKDLLVLFSKSSYMQEGS